jgi:hypothetical protein
MDNETIALIKAASEDSYNAGFIAGQFSGWEECYKSVRLVFDKITGKEKTK